MNIFGITSEIDPVYFVYIGVFLGVILLFEGLKGYLLGSESTNSVQAKRLKALRSKHNGSNAEILVNQSQKKKGLAKISLYEQVPLRMEQAGMKMKAPAFLSVCLGISALVLFVGSFTVGVPIGLGMALLCGVVIPMTVINIVRAKRVAAFAAQLPDALDLMKRGLRVGHPLNVTFANVAHSMPDPIATEFMIMSQQITYGDTLIDAMTDMANRIDQEDMHYLAASVAIQHGTGGNLAGMLGTLSSVIRQRFAMRRKIKAISSEGRISAWVLSSLPFLMYGGTSLTAPGYYASVSDDPLYMPIALAVVGLVVANFLALRGLVNFRI